MIGADERAAMERTVRAAIAEAGADVDAVLAKLGWLEMLEDDPDDAVDIVFGALGAANATATTLDDVIASALGQKPRADLAVLLPRFATWDPPGRIDANELHAHGLATRRADTAAEMLVVCGVDSEPWSIVVSKTAAEVQAVRGGDPDAGLRTVPIHGHRAGATRLDPTPRRSALAP